jgi:flagellar biosynthesis protein FlhB
MALLPTADLADLLPTIVALVGRLLKGTLIAVTAIAIIDFAYQKYSFMQSMKMSKQEIKDEHKQSEGDPHMKARVRAIRIGRSRKRMMAAVPGASVVITNPTHFAVALKYDISMMSAPIVVAKGADFIAARIRALAEEHGVPLIENPPVARALYATVELDQEIPPEHYKAVAEIISFVMKLKRPGDGARPVNSR